MRLRLLDPVTLEPLATFELPDARHPAGLQPVPAFTGGGYFYLDQRDRAVIPTSDLHVVVIALRNGPQGPAWAQARDYDLSHGPGG